jgi:hypothetical protein
MATIGKYHDIPAYSVIFRHIPWYSGIFRDIPPYSVIFRHIPWHSGIVGFTNCFALFKRAIDWDTFLHCASLCICSFHFNCSSIMTPRTFLLETCCIIWLPITISGLLEDCCSLYLEPTSMHSVFSWFNVNLLAISHFCTFSKSVLILFSISVDDLPWQDKFVSSANIEACVFWDLEIKSH